MSSSPLPPKLQAAVTLMQHPRPNFDPFDPALRTALLEWGLDQIEHEIQPDPLLRPLDYLRKQAAAREWRRVVREQGVQQRDVAAGFHTTLAQEALNDILFDIQERRRRIAADWDKEQRIDEFGRTTAIATDHEIRKIEAAAAATAAMQPPPPPDPMVTIRQLQREIDTIERDPTLSEEQKHRKTQLLHDALQHILKR